jgi:hypothetical protein
LFPNVTIEVETVYPFYWKHAVHMWKPGCEPDKEWKKWIQPNKKEQYYFVNEAFSMHHGWVEGSLESVDECIEQMKMNEWNK